jgi:hypothetical protein
MENSDIKDRIRLDLKILQDASTKVSSLTGELAKWLYASLLTVNMAGLAATTFSSTRDNISSGSEYASLLFLSGVFFAFMLGYATIPRGGRYQQGLAAKIGLNLKLLVDDLPSEKEKQEVDSFDSLLKKRPLISELFGFSSLLAFLAGAGLLASAPIFENGGYEFEEAMVDTVEMPADVDYETEAHDHP